MLRFISSYTKFLRNTEKTGFDFVEAIYKKLTTRGALTMIQMSEVYLQLSKFNKSLWLRSQGNSMHGGFAAH